MNSHSQPLLVATLNTGKLREFQAYFTDLPFEIVGLHSLGNVAASPEDGETFEQNACQKADYYSRLFTGLTAADDSGLIVDALGGKPGIHSARYLSPSATDEERYREILRQLQQVGESSRSARFVCCLALASEGRLIRTFQGTVEGKIAFEPRGENGFGYDPIFLLPKLNRTMAELTATEKLEVSHRGEALRKMRDYLRSGFR